MEIEFTIHGEPMGKQRPKFSRVGGFVRTYTPEKTANFEHLVALYYEQEVNERGVENEENLPIFSGELGIEINAYFQIPKSVSKKKRAEMVENKIRPTKKPDIDNIAKIILDGLNKIAFADDTQVVSLIVRKYYAEMPCTKVRIWEIKY